jgi:hypothetical protein
MVQPLDSGPSSDSLRLIRISNPTDGSWRRVVRAHAARARHAKSRELKAQEAMMLRAVDNHRLQMVVPHPRASLRTTGIDPFNTLSRPTTRLESHLMNHCMLKPVLDKSSAGRNC